MSPRCTSTPRARRLTAPADGLADMTRIAASCSRAAGSSSTTSASSGRASTTCSSASPATAPSRTTGPATSRRRQLRAVDEPRMSRPDRHHRAPLTRRRRARRTAPHDTSHAGLVRQVGDDGVAQPQATSSGSPRCCTDVTIQPVMFVLLFAFVFGGSIAVARVQLPGVAAARDHGPDDGLLRRSSSRSASTWTSARASSTGSGPLPIARPSVLVGRSLYSLIHSSIGIFVMSLTGLAIGWRIRSGVAEGVCWPSRCCCSSASR